MKEKEKKTVRISFVNVNGIGSKAKSSKSEDIRQYMVENDVDVMGLAETNVNWGKVRNKDTLWDRTKQWFSNRRIGVAYNTHQKLSTNFQPGGTATLATNDIAHRFKRSGFDESGLGRWSWVQITGKQRCTTRFITVYCPTRSGTGLNTVYEQQLAHLKVNPTKAFWNDLAHAIVAWQTAGEQLVIMGDWNEDVTGENLKSWMKTFGLTEAITSMHGDSAPPTYHRGSHAIDGIYISSSIKVNRAGYLGFGMIPGDHRGIWMDISQRHILGYKMADIPTAQARRLKLDDPRVVARYQEQLDIYLSRNKLYSRLRRLRNDIVIGDDLTPEQAKEYEALDIIREKGMKLAARKCRKLRMGGKRWSPALQEARNTILFWTLIRRRLKKCKVGARQILRLKKKLGIKRSTNLSLTEVDKILEKSFKKYKVSRKNDVSLRLNYQENLANAKAAAGDREAQQVIKDMQHREQVRTTYRRIRSSTKKGQTGTTKIHLRTSRGIKEVTKKHEMERHIIKENESKFHQTEDRCPLLRGKLYSDLGVMGDGPKVASVLDGTYKPPHGTSEVTIAWLKRMKIEDPAALQTVKTSLADYRRGWRLIKEQTASGELHMGHFKAGAMHKKLGWVDFQMSLLPMATGYSPKRWQKGIDVMLLKAPEVFLLDKLRTIVLYEADFNHENKRLGKDAMGMALKQGMIAKEQFSRPGRSAQDNALSKRLVFDYFRLQKRPFGMCACDLKSCYDRVVHTAASLALQRVGVPISQIRCMFGTIQNLIHRIRTAFGLSAQSFGGHSKNYKRPPQGMGQGNGAGPTVWSILSSTIFEELHDQGFSTPFCLSLSMGTFQLCGFSYVDDCDLIADGDDADNVHYKLQKMLTLWDELMEVNGAAIAPDKCWWYLVDFVWNGGCWKYKDAGVDRTLQVRDKDGVFNELKYLPLSTAKKMVGVFLAPDGNQTTQLKELRTKASTWSQKIRASPLDDISVWIAMNQTILRGLEYPLVATTLTEKQLTSVMTPVLQTALPRSGFTRKFPHSVLYGPAAYQGLGVSNLYDFQYCRHVQDIVDQTWRNTPTGQLIKVNLEAVKLEAGVFGYLFDNPIHITWFNTSSSWVIETYKFCRTHTILFQEPGKVLSPQCTNDRSLMEVFCSSGMPQEDLIRLNRCRLFFQVVTVSDISDGSGTIIAQKWFQRKRDIYHQTRHHWPEQGPPTRQDWELWDSSLRTCILNGHILSPILGNWKMTLTEYNTSWAWYLTQDNRLILYNGANWMEFSPASVRQTRRHRFQIDSERHLETPIQPQLLHRTVVTHQGPYLEATGYRHLAPSCIQCTPQHPESWLAQILRHEHSSWICQWMQLPNTSFSQCMTALYSDNVVGVSDGSFDDSVDICTAAWILDFKDAGEARGGGVVPGPEGQSSAYRGELGGLLGQLVIIWSIEQRAPPPAPYTIPIACDGKSALFKSLLISRESFSSQHKCFDLISQIIVLREGIRGKLKPTHVYGHQDDTGRSLTSLEILNVRMDALAKEILSTVLSQDEDVPDALPLSGIGLVQVDYGDIPITSSLSSSLRKFIGQDRILDWWQKKRRFNTLTWQRDIDWTVVNRTTTELSFAMGRFVSKWTSHHIAVGRMMEFRQARDTNDCPRCGHSEETTLHVLRCRAKSSRKHWRKGIRSLEKWMRHKKTDPTIRRALAHSLRQFNKPHQNFDTYIHTNLCGEALECFWAQADIGWTGFLEGLLSNKWAPLQEQYFRYLNLRRSGLRWAIELSKQLWKLVFSMWDHRNSLLFNTNKIDDLSGIQKVKIAVEQERNLGLGTLDPSFLPYLSLTHTSFSKMTSLDLRRWLSLIRQAREEKMHTYNDELATSKPLRAWVGLSDQTPSRDHSSRRRQLNQIRFIRTGYCE